MSVRLVRITYELEHEGGTDNECQESAPVFTGIDGAFQFHDVPRRGILVLATGDTILGAGEDLERMEDPVHIELVASLRLHVQVVLDAPTDRVDALRVFDGEGKRVPLSVFHGGGSHASDDMPIRDGRSDVISVQEGAATIALYRREEEVARLPLTLQPGETCIVRY